MNNNIDKKNELTEKYFKINEIIKKNNEIMKQWKNKKQEIESAIKELFDVNETFINVEYEKKIKLKEYISKDEEIIDFKLLKENHFDIYQQLIKLQIITIKPGKKQLKIYIRKLK